jgi:hypothetical protein
MTGVHVKVSCEAFDSYAAWNRNEVPWRTRRREVRAQCQRLAAALFLDKRSARAAASLGVVVERRLQTERAGEEASLHDDVFWKGLGCVQALWSE